MAMSPLLSLASTAFTHRVNKVRTLGCLKGGSSLGTSTFLSHVKWRFAALHTGSKASRSLKDSHGLARNRLKPQFAGPKDS